MTINMWIGRLDDISFKRKGGNRNGNTSREISPTFPPISEPKASLYGAFLQAEHIGTRQTDWGACVARAPVVQFASFVEISYQGDEELPAILCALPERKECLSGLNQNSMYALVTAES